MFGFGARNNMAIGVLNFELSLMGQVPVQNFVKDSILKDQLVAEIK